MPYRKPPRILISHQGCVPIYRKGLFDRLAKIPSVEYVVAYGKPPRRTDYLVLQPPYEFHSLPIVNHEISIGRSSLIWQPLTLRFLCGFDAAILGDEAKYLSHLAIIAVARMTRRPVILWGFGYHADNSTGRARGRLERLANQIGKMLRTVRLRMVDGYLSYTDAGTLALAELGFRKDRIVTVQNTIDIEYQRSLREAIARETELECRLSLGLPQDGAVLLYFGRFQSEKRIDLLIDYIRYCKENGRNVSAVIFGKGAEAEALQQKAEGLERVFFRTHDDRDLTRALRVSSAVVIPEHLGLAITHAFAHGVPLITREGKHGPEIAYLSHGQNGLLLPPQTTEFFHALDAYLSDHVLQQRLRSGAETTAKTLSSDTMATKIDGLVQDLLRLSDCRA